MASIRLARDWNAVSLEIRDEGNGISPERLAQIQAGGSGVGIRGMRERVAQFSGTMSVESDASGTKILVKVPIPKSVSGDESGFSEPLPAAV